MSNLMMDSMVDCVMMDKTTVSDGMGGFSSVWVEGATFKAFVRKESAPEIKVAEKDGAHEMFTVVVPKTTALEYHDVFKRVSDGEIFRLTSRTLDGATLKESTIPIASASCERWELS